MNGIILIDKPQDWTSMDVCAKLRGALRTKRVGHSGTLDPMATGLLVVFMGRATRAVQFAENDEKEYFASLRLGVETDTLDIWGNTLRESPADIPDGALENALEGFRGEIDQVPPMYSAIKLRGEKLYDIARRGGEVERKPRRVTIHELEMLGREGGEVFLRVRCSKGTYIRSLCADIGARLGCGGCMSALRRTRAGRFSIDDARTIDELTRPGCEIDRFILPVESLFAGLERLTVSPDAEKALRNGGSPAAARPDGEYAVFSASGEFLALCRASGGKMRVIKSFYEVQK